jgi:hypothetical protein
MKHLMLITCVASLLLVCVSSYADEIHLNDGTVVKGAIIRITDRHIEYDPEGESPFDIFPRGQIAKIVYDSGRVVELNEGMEPALETKEEKAPPARKQAENGFHRHDGLFFRVQYGFGYGESKIEDLYPGESLTLSGTAGVFNIQLGYSLVDNLALYLELGSMAIVDAKAEWANGGPPGAKGKTDVSTASFGLGLCWYFMPANVYVSPTLALAVTGYEGDLIEGDSRGGTGLSLSVGKEWWVSANWGLGAALYGGYGWDTVEEKVTKTTSDVRNWYAGIALSATWN